MGSEPGPQLAGEKASRLIILLISSLLYTGGIFQAYQALKVESAPLDDLHRIAAQAPPADSLHLPDTHCHPHIDLSITSFTPLINSQLRTASHMQHHKITAKISSSTNAAFPHLDIQAQHNVAYIDVAETAPFLEPCNSSDGDDYDSNTCTTKGISPGQAKRLGWLLYSQIAHRPIASSFTALVLHTPYGALRPLQIDTNGAVGVSKVAYQLSEKVLLVLLAEDGNDDDGEEGNDSSGAAAADQILSWLSIGSEDSSSSSSSIEEISRQCLQKAEVEIKKFLNILETAGTVGVGVTPALAAAAAEAADAYDHAKEEQEEQRIRLVDERRVVVLGRSRDAWKKARILMSHSDLVLPAQIPSEHILALLLPIGLPIALVLVQAVARDVRAGRKQKQKTA